MPEVRPVLNEYEVWVKEEEKPARTELAKAFRPEDLVMQYEMMGLVPGKEFKIMRMTKRGEPVQQNTNHNAQGITNDQGAIPLLSVEDLHEDVQQVAVEHIAKAPELEPAPVIPVSPNQVAQASEPVVAEPVVEPPKIWNVGDIEFKLEGGKMYQRAWTTIPIEELLDGHGIRIRSLESGEITELEDHAIEIKEWVEVSPS
jgi:hypothetical protein